MNKQIGSIIVTLFAVVTLSLHSPQVTAKDNPPQAPSAGNPVTPTTQPTISQEEIKAAQFVAPDPTPTESAPTAIPISNIQPTGDKNSWLAASGIVHSDWNYVDYIISRESGWNPNSTNPYSGAHGLPQAEPYSKTGCGWTDAVCQLQWANGYATSKYGSWAGAYNFWRQHNYW